MGLRLSIDRAVSLALEGNYGCGPGIEVSGARPGAVMAGLGLSMDRAEMTGTRSSCNDGPRIEYK